MKRGGTVLFDTRDAVEAPPGPGGATRGPGMVALRVDPVGARHSRTRAGAARPCADQDILSAEASFPAASPPASSGSRRRRAPTTTTIDTRPARAGDGVSSLIITSNDLAGAWAMRPDGQPMLPMMSVRAAPARIRVPRRRQHRDVHADRQLQGRSGPYPGAAGTAGTVGTKRPHPSRRALRALSEDEGTLLILMVRSVATATRLEP